MPETTETVPPLHNLSDIEIRRARLYSIQISMLAALFSMMGIYAILTSLQGLFAGDMHAAKPLLIASLLLIGGVGLYLRSKWGRILGLFICALMLLHIPVGTIIGGLGLFSLAKGKFLFGPERWLSHKLSEEIARRKESRQ